MKKNTLKKIIPAKRLTSLRRMYKTKPEKAVILAGVAVLENAGWTRGEFAKTASHKAFGNQDDYGNSDRDIVISPVAGSFCAVGALCRGQYEIMGNCENTRAAERILEKGLDTYDIVDWNDEVAKSKAKVIKAFEKVAAEL